MRVDVGVACSEWDMLCASHKSCTALSRMRLLYTALEVSNRTSNNGITLLCL